MKLSDVKGDRVFDVIADLIDPVSNIAKDHDAKAIFKRGEKIPEGKTANEVFGERVKAHLPGILKNHKDDIVTILATISGVTPDEYRENMTLGSLMTDVISLLGDETFLGFLASQESEKDGAPSTSA